ncbi:hypothetical protein NEOLEDRAFT_150057 [Neolentinus lepideus HHB14362 ss-1]|uniref:Uncharacterized protein n=1 Tax=Neolentinus lepideus HHB14362 ss-1 TaxID=1314782 RepID=A0A165MNN4_9AGAM|nr:hypothetical protein NEOLEDRAFT_150057 [Neolentinus lepideus HHB14362 ss-1]
MHPVTRTFLTTVCVQLHRHLIARSSVVILNYLFPAFFYSTCLKTPVPAAVPTLRHLILCKACAFATG